MENTCLYHHGIKGQRWGVRRTPAQLGHPVTKTTKKKKTSAKSQTKSKELTTEEKKSKVLESRSAKTLYENRKLFNYDEMNRAYKLLETDKKVRDLIVNEPNKVEKFFDDKLIPWANRVKNLTNPVVDTMASLDKASKIIGGDDDKQNGKSKNSKAEPGKKDKGAKKDDADDSDTSKAKKDKSVKKDDDDSDTPKSKKDKGVKKDDADDSGTPKAKKDKGAKKDDTDDTKDVEWEWLGRDTGSSVSTGNGNSNSSQKDSTIYWDDAYSTYTPSSQTTSFVASLGNRSVSSLTTSGSSSLTTSGSSSTATSANAQTFVAGLLGYTKED